MADSCYLCRRTQAELDRLNEETRARVYLSYFSNARAQLDDVLQRIGLLERLADEEGGGPYFRQAAGTVFAALDSEANTLPWLRALRNLVPPGALDPTGTIEDLVAALIAEHRQRAAALERILADLRSTLASPRKGPLVLEPTNLPVPIDGAGEPGSLVWSSAGGAGPEPLHRSSDGTRARVDLPVHLCTVCRILVDRPTSPRERPPSGRGAATGGTERPAVEGRRVDARTDADST